MDLDKACRAHGTWKVNFRSKNHWAPTFRFPEGKHMRVQRLARRWGQINLPKFGLVRFRMTREIGGTIRSATLTRESVHGQWFLSILVEDGVLEATCDPALPTVGIDRGVTVALARSDGRMMDRDFTSPSESARLVKLQRQAARQRGPRTPKGGRREPSKRWQRSQQQIAKLHRRQRQRRDDFTAKAATELTRTHSVIALESLQITNMTKKATPKPDPDQPGAFLHNRAAQKSGLNRAILAKGWGKFLLALRHQARYTGTRIVLVPAAFTSQRCHQCGHTCKENRDSQAVFSCTQCGHTAHADTNAALNIQADGLRHLDAQVPVNTGPRQPPKTPTIR